MTGNVRARRLLAAASLVLLGLAAGCAGPAPGTPPEPAPPAAPAPPAISPGYTLDPPLHRNPVTIAWHPTSASFFVGTYHDGTIYRGQLDDPTAQVFLEGRLGQSAHGLATDEQRLYVAGGMYGDIRVVDLARPAAGGPLRDRDGRVAGRPGPDAGR